VVRGNQDDKALAQYVQWKSGTPLVRLVSVFVADTSYHNFEGMSV